MLRALLSRSGARLPRRRRVALGLEALEGRLVPAAITAAFDPSGALAILAGPGGATVSVAETAGGAVAVTCDDRTIAVGAGVRDIRFSGGGAADGLTLDGFAAPSDLTISGDGGVTLAGDVTAAGRLARIMHRAMER